MNNTDNKEVQKNELDETELDKIVGAGNPFENKERVPVNDYDEDIKNKV